MKAFRFNLQNVMEWHGRKAEAERSELERMRLAKHHAVQRREAIQGELRELGNALSRRPISAQELAQTASYQQVLAQQHRRLRDEVAQWDRRIEAQRQKCVESDRRFRLLEKFRERRLSEWQREFDAETESNAASSFLSRWVRDSLT